MNMRRKNTGQPPTSIPAERSQRETISADGVDHPGDTRRSPSSIMRWAGRAARARVLGLILPVAVRVDRLLIRLGAKSRLFASGYYFLFSKAFGQEHLSVLSGRVSFDAQVREPHPGSSLLRRNIHRLEKGLLMEPRKTVFATDYVSETVRCFEKILQLGGSLAAASIELQWAHDVLQAYFDATERDSQTDSARIRFQELSHRFVAREGRLVPEIRGRQGSPPVTIDGLAALAQRRRSVRWFLQKPVPRELIDRAMEVAAQSPSACNRQPFIFRVLDEKELLRKAVSIPMGMAGFEHNIPMLIVVVGQLRYYFSERDRHLIYIDASLAAMAFALALETLGLSSCFINCPATGLLESSMAELLRLDADELPVVCVAVGYGDPEGLVANSSKRPLNQLLKYNFE